VCHKSGESDGGERRKRISKRWGKKLKGKTQKEKESMTSGLKHFQSLENQKI
jgi:hypothetical protein